VKPAQAPEPPPRAERNEERRAPQRRQEEPRGGRERRPDVDRREAPARTEWKERATPKVHGPVAPQEKQPPAPRRPLAEGHTRLFVSAGEHNQLTADQVTELIQNVAQVPAKAVAEVDIRDRHTFVDVPSEHAPKVVDKLNRYRFQDRRLKVKVA
jgi:hypothetical protein